MYRLFFQLFLPAAVLAFSAKVSAQTYTSYFVGGQTDVVTQSKGGVCLMGGATEHDNAMRWFLQQANGGDILVLRTTGSDGYNDYLLNQLGVSVNSVETIVCHSPASSQEAYIQNKISHAEGIWFAGGDQWDYITYWRNTPIDSLINLAIRDRKIVIGGTSAGMAIQGGLYFSAQNGTVTSQTALSDPYDQAITVSSERFIVNKYLEDVITDTHYDNPDRRGRHVVFMARVYTDSGLPVRGIACEEYTSVCIDTNGMCRIYGDYPSYDEDIYFIQPNCELNDMTPETCLVSTPLTWNRSGSSLKVYHAKGTQNGTQTFDLSNWTEGVDGVWENWYIIDGQLFITPSTSPGCSLDIEKKEEGYILKVANPASGIIELNQTIENLQLFDMSGRLTLSNSIKVLDTTKIKNGTYILRYSAKKDVHIMRIQIHN